MTMLIRLLAYPPGELTPGVPSFSTQKPACLSCLLQASALPDGYTLEVAIQGRPLSGTWQQDQQQLFSWQCAQGEAIRIILRGRGKRSRREWLGCWNGEEALLHAGSLPIQVSFAGRPQPEVDPAEIVPWLSVAEHNGHSQPPCDTEELEVLAGATQITSLSVEQNDTLQEHIASGNTTSSPRPEVHASATKETLDAPEGTRLATWHADPLRADALDMLHALLARMPEKTLLVDLRQHPRKGRVREHGPLSKQQMRQTFGARYWDRGWSIRTIQRLSSTEEGARCCAVITNPTDPEGLPLLVERLRRGYSLVLIDRTASYAESARAAVVAALHQQISTLTLGPLS